MLCILPRLVLAVLPFSSLPFALPALPPPHLSTSVSLFSPFCFAGLSRGAIAAAVVVPILAVTILFAFILYRRKAQESVVTTFARKDASHFSPEGTGVNNPLHTLRTPGKDIQLRNLSLDDPVRYTSRLASLFRSPHAYVLHAVDRRKHNGSQEQLPCGAK